MPPCCRTQRRCAGCSHRVLREGPFTSVMHTLIPRIWLARRRQLSMIWTRLGCQEVIGLTVGPGGATRTPWSWVAGVYGPGPGPRSLMAADRLAAIAAAGQQRPAGRSRLGRLAGRGDPVAAMDGPETALISTGPMPESARVWRCLAGSRWPASCCASLLERGPGATAATQPASTPWTPWSTPGPAASDPAGGRKPTAVNGPGRRVSRRCPQQRLRCPVSNAVPSAWPARHGLVLPRPKLDVSGGR